MELFAPTRWMPVPARYGGVLWLSFLLAAAATGAFFSVIDPEALRDCMPLPAIGSRGAYTIGFFSFWLLTAASGLLAVAFTYPPAADGAGVAAESDDPDARQPD